MTKVTCIVGSARNNGSCAYLINILERGLLERGIEVIKYFLCDADLHFCKGCKKCYNDGMCVHDDDVQVIIKDILTSDFVVIASPSYWAGVPAQLKTLFDRTTPYGDTNPKRLLKPNKAIYGITIAVRAGVMEQENELILNSIEHYFGHLGIQTIERISVTQTDTLEDLKEKNHDKIEHIYRLAQNINKV